MSKTNTQNLTDKQITAIIKDTINTEAGEKAVLATMDKLFEDGRWEIPDDAIVGIYAKKVDQLEAQIKSLTSLMSNLSARIEGKPAAPSGRVDALEATKKGKK